jgi:parvulin-like peptidyl-prolyl isomerase
MRQTLALLTFWCSTAAVAAAQAVPTDAVVARVGERTVTAAELREVIIDQRRTGDMPKVIEALTPEGQRRILQQLIDVRLLAIGARDARLDRDASVQRAIERAVDQVLADQLARREVASLDEAAVREYYDSHDTLFRTGQRVHIRHIVVASEAEAQQALDLLGTGRDFAALAGERNTDVSKRANGDLGWVSRGVRAEAGPDERHRANLLRIPPPARRRGRSRCASPVRDRSRAGTAARGRGADRRAQAVAGSEAPRHDR